MLDEVVGGYDLKKRKLRQALSIALNIEEYIQIFLNGRGIGAQSPIPPGIFGYQEGPEGINPIIYEWDAQLRSPRRKDLKTAKGLLAEAGYTDGKPLVLFFDTVAGGPESKAVLDWLRKQFAAIGVQLQVRTTDYNQFQTKVLQGNFQLIQWGWSADYPDPENFLFLLYGPNAKVTSQGENAANYDNPRFNELFRRAENMVNSAERAALIRDMLAIAQEDAPWIWGFHPVGYGLYHAWQHNTKPLTFGGNTLKYKRIDPDLREQSRIAWNRPITAPLWGGADGTHFSHDSGDHQHLQTPTQGATAMMTYIIRRCLYAIPVLFGVNVLVFLLFFFVNSPDHMARAHLGQKRVTPEQIDAWKRQHLLHLPYFYNAGWRRIGSLPAAESDNTAEFPSADSGEYAS